jgi:uncharacterized protein
MFVGYIVLGLLAGAFSGLVGVGGGVIIVPALIFFFGFGQQQAQGTTLALLVPPIGILAAWTYYKQGLVNFEAAGLICIGFLVGGLLGAKFATEIPGPVMEKIFGGFILVIGIKMLFFGPR